MLLNLQEMWKKGFILQGDLKARLGPSNLKGDPNEQNENGNLFQQFLERHPQLTVLNSLDICKGLITRVRRLCTRKVEKSVLDFFFVCSYVLTHITEMLIDEDINYAMTNYTQVPKGGKAVDSDHMTTVAKMKLNIVPHKVPTSTVYN